MQFLVIFLVCALAVGNAEECTEERAETCVETLLTSILTGSSDEEVCKELKTSIDCLRDAVDECISQKDRDDEVEEGLRELEKVLNDNCKTSDDDEDDRTDVQKCFDENEKLIMDCIQVGTIAALEAMMDHGAEIDEDTMRCTTYALIAGCFIERVEKECGEEAGRLMEEEMADLPPEVKESCGSLSEIEVHSFQLLDKKRK